MLHFEGGTEVVLLGPSWSAYYHVYSEVVRAFSYQYYLRDRQPYRQKKYSAPGTAEALVNLQPNRHMVACHLRNVLIGNLIQVSAYYGPLEVVSIADP